MANTVQIVDKIDASPTVLLDLNDETSWWVREFRAPPPRLRRSVFANAMRDGAHHAASQYDDRLLTIVLDSRESTQDAAATQLQTLFRLLDTADGKYLKYQPDGASSPVFFALKRADITELLDVPASAAMRQLTVEIPAESFALGLLVEHGPYQIDNDPASSGNPQYVDLPTIIGDVPAPLIYWDGSSGLTYGRRYLTTWATDSPQHLFEQAENMTLGTDTSNPGGAASTTFSGSGSNNYVVTNFGTVTAMEDRLRWTITATDGSTAGRWRLLVFGALTALSDAYTVRAVVSNDVTQTGETIAWPNTASRVVLDLGIFNLGPANVVTAGYSQSRNSLEQTLIDFEAAGPNTTSLRWDCALLLPVGGQIETAGLTSAFVSSAQKTVVDSVTEDVAYIETGSDIIDGLATVGNARAELAGGFPYVHPGVGNRLFVIAHESPTSPPRAAVNSYVSAYVAYWPRYLFVRPVST